MRDAVLMQNPQTSLMPLPSIASFTRHLLPLRLDKSLVIDLTPVSDSP